MTKTWVEKRETDKVYQVKVNPKKFSDIPPQTKMLIPTPRILDTLIRQIPKSLFLYFKQIRKELAYKYDAEMTCSKVDLWIRFYYSKTISGRYYVLR